MLALESVLPEDVTGAGMRQSGLKVGRTRQFLAARFRSEYLVFLLLVLSTLANLRLIDRNRDLRKQNLRSGPQFFVEGEVVPLDGLSLDRKSVQYFADRQGGAPTIILVLSPFCGWCKVNLANWREIVSQVEGRFRVVAVSADGRGVDGYMEENGLARIPVLIEPDPGNELAFKFVLTPQTILVNPRGVVQKNWVGAFGEDERREIESTLGVRLPDSYFDEVGRKISSGRRNVKS